jgi:hypothetical protein
MVKKPRNGAPASELSETLGTVLESAAKLQEIVPDAVLVGGSAAALYAGHRDSFDHDHVLQDLVDRYGIVLDAVEASEGWATSVRASRPPFTVLGTLDGVEAGLRQLRRSLPLETTEFDLGDGRTVVVPTLEEILRIKAYLVVQRNAVRDYLDVVALTETLGLERAVQVLRDIDTYYLDRSETEGSVLTTLILRLATPEPKDSEVTTQLKNYKGLARQWQEWGAVEKACHELAHTVAEHS